MYKLLQYSLPFMVLGLFLSACKKDDDIEFSTTPEIEFISINPTVADEFSDDITIKISYKDGDGDLGENDPDVRNAFITDSRNSVVYELRIQELAPGGSSIAIQGELNLVLEGTGITNESSSQSVSYSVYIKDRAGNASNSVSTSSITVVQ